MADYAHLIQTFEQAGQGQIFRFWDQLDADQQQKLADQASEIDLEEIHRLSGDAPGSDGSKFEGLSPAPVIPRPEHGGNSSRWQEAKALGEKALKEGKVAAFTVAGGQGTRLGCDGPKGKFGVTPINGHSLFQVFAEKVAAAAARYGCAIPWLIMTSELNHEETESFFVENGYFGLDPDKVIFFRQGTMPAVDADGKILLSGKDQIALSPDGHGGSLRALVRSGALARIAELGCTTISYFQVDNPLVRPLDPEFIGFHLMHESQFSSKSLQKAYPEEKVGVFCKLADGSLGVLEYSDMPQELMEATDDDGGLLFGAGSIAIHVIDCEFVRSVGSGEDEAFRLPFHRAHKKIPVVNDGGEQVTPEEPNGTKFEMFVFDALPFAENPIVVETTRSLDFSPVKNKEGVDSPETSAADQMKLWASWIIAAGGELAVDTNGNPSIRIEISPLFADSAEVFAEKWAQLDPKPSLEADLVL